MSASSGKKQKNVGNCFLFLTELDSKREHIPNVRNKLQDILIIRVQKLLQNRITARQQKSWSFHPRFHVYAEWFLGSLYIKKT